MSPVKWLMMGVVVFVIAIILLISVVLPQMHTGYTYVNNTMTEMTGGGSLWGVFELLVTVVFMFSGLGMAGFGIFNEVKNRSSRKRSRY